MAPANGVTATPDAVLAAVDRISAHRLFAESPRLSRFLRYVVEESLAGRSAGIKEYTVAVEVYGRPPGFDPRTDATVRVEAGRLRSKLTKYYLEEGDFDPIRISLPRGTYIPVIAESAVATAAPPAAEQPQTPIRSSWNVWTWIGIALAVATIGATVAALRNRPIPAQELLAIAVLPVVNATGEPELSQFATGMVNELTSRISAEGVFRVASRTDSDHLGQSLSNMDRFTAYPAVFG
jgi:adenylate cyclase